MEGKREQAVVGLFVIVALAILAATVFSISGAFGRSMKTYHAYFPFAGGLEPGSTVRYAGGPKVGRVETLKIDPQNPARMDVTFKVQSDLPVRTDSHVKIMSLSPLGDNHLEVLAGKSASPAPDGALLIGDPYTDFNAITEQINNIAPKAQQLLVTLNERATEMKETINRVNDLLSTQNRANLAATLAQTRGMITEDRPVLNSSLHHVNDASQKLGPLIDNFKKTSDQATLALNHIDGMVNENRPDVHQAVVQLRETLAEAKGLIARLDQTLDVNSENIDELLENLRHVSENLKEFTNTIKTRPYTLIRASVPRDHIPGAKP
ncbi:MAG TPA: MlaD family protein [Candidatus Eremiobacteraceae bacterium]|nr:MlaD family protein [Candidatus Eremiobacteraceae bacterium]